MAHFSLDLNQKMPINEVSLILRCLLDRLPIIIYGNNNDELDEISSLLIKFVPNRHELVFWVDFATLDEYNSIIEKEEQDLESARTVVRVPALEAKQAIKNFKNLKSWIISIPSEAGLIEDLIEFINKNNKDFLIINLIKPIKVELISNSSSSNLNVKFEKKIIDTILQNSADSLEKIKRVLKKKIFGSELSSLLTSNLLNFSGEKNGLEENIFQSEILSFVSASKRGLLLLNRLNLINEFKIDASISPKTFLDSIQYDRADAARILDFIKAEWGYSFHNFVKSGKLSVFGDIIDGLWG